MTLSFSIGFISALSVVIVFRSHIREHENRTDDVDLMEIHSEGLITAINHKDLNISMLNKIYLLSLVYWNVLCTLRKKSSFYYDMISSSFCLSLNFLLYIVLYIKSALYVQINFHKFISES